MMQASERATCSFESCEPSIIGRVVGAAVDQLCAQHDIDIALLDALEHPVGESMVALAPFGIGRVDIHVDPSTLRLDVHLSSDVADPTAALGDATTIIFSFFELQPLEAGRGLTLVGSLA